MLKQKIVCQEYALRTTTSTSIFPPGSYFPIELSTGLRDVNQATSGISKFDVCIASSKFAPPRSSRLYLDSSLNTCALQSARDGFLSRFVVVRMFAFFAKNVPLSNSFEIQYFATNIRAFYYCFFFFNPCVLIGRKTDVQSNSARKKILLSYYR